MLALYEPIKARLRGLAPLTAWAVRTNTDEVDRSILPAADVRFVGALVPTKRDGAVTVAPVLQVLLVLRRGDGVAERLDAALSAVICSLHGWQPGCYGGRGWNQLSLERITEPTLADEGLVGYELEFSSAGLYAGQQ